MKYANCFKMPFLKVQNSVYVQRLYTEGMLLSSLTSPECMPVQNWRDPFRKWKRNHNDLQWIIWFTVRFGCSWSDRNFLLESINPNAVLARIKYTKLFVYSQNICVGYSLLSWLQFLWLPNQQILKTTLNII